MLGRALLAIVVGLAIAITGGGVWSVMFAANFATNPALPWSIPAMLVALLVGWLYLSGWGPPVSTKASRAALLPRTRLTASEIMWATAAAFGASGVFLALLLAAYRTLPIPMSPLPPAAVSAPGLSLAYFAMASLVAGVVEEAAFRGYMQHGLERSIGRAGAFLLVALFFALFHGAHPEVLFLIPIYIGTSVSYSIIVAMSGSLWPAILAHAVADFMSFALLLFVGPARLTARADVHDPDADLLLVLVAGSIAFAVAIISYWRLGTVTQSRPSTAA